MRFIDRNSPPPELAAWFASETILDQRHYDGSLSTEVKTAIRRNRVMDQGFLCAYTMRRIQEINVGGEMDFDAHLEHVVTRKSSKQRGDLDETVDYRNLVACVNRKADLPYGASARGDTVEDLPVHPFRPNCSAHFSFHLDGKISGINPDASKTICKLKLCHPSLISLRQSRLSARGFGIARPGTPGVRQLPSQKISATSAQRIAVEIMNWSADGRLPEFCAAISQAAIKHAERVEKQARHLKFARSAS